MCNPAAAFWATTALSAYGSYDQGQQQRSTSAYNARVLENEAIRTRNKGVVEENRHRERVQQLISSQRAASAASGVDVNSGSALQLQQDAELLGEVDALTIRQNYQDQADVTDARSDLVALQGRNSGRAGAIGAASLLGSASFGNQALGVSSIWYKRNSAINNPIGISANSAANIATSVR